MKPKKQSLKAQVEELKHRQDLVWKVLQGLLTAINMTRAEIDQLRKEVQSGYVR